MTCTPWPYVAHNVRCSRTGGSGPEDGDRAFKQFIAGLVVLGPPLTDPNRCTARVWVVPETLGMRIPLSEVNSVSDERRRACREMPDNGYRVAPPAPSVTSGPTPVPGEQGPSAARIFGWRWMQPGNRPAGQDDYDVASWLERQWLRDSLAAAGHSPSRPGGQGMPTEPLTVMNIDELDGSSGSFGVIAALDWWPSADLGHAAASCGACSIHAAECSLSLVPTCQTPAG